MPQFAGRILKSLILTPRKPNSALRKSWKVFSNKKGAVIAGIRGSGNLPVKYNIILCCFKGYRDTPNVNYLIIRNKLECSPVFDKTRKRSLFGVKKKTKLFTAKRSMRKWVVLELLVLELLLVFSVLSYILVQLYLILFFHEQALIFYTVNFTNAVLRQLPIIPPYWNYIFF